VSATAIVSAQEAVDFGRSLIFHIWGALYKNWGLPGPPTTIYHKVSWWACIIYAKTYDIRHTQYEPPGRQAFKNRRSPNVFMQCLAFH